MTSDIQYCDVMMQTARNKIQIFIIFHLLLVASSFWLRYQPEEEDDDDGFLTLEESFSDNVFNSRGPRALYRGLEEDTEFSWDSIEDYDEDFVDHDDYFNFWSFYDF